jgi:hypothetical protein
VLIIVASSMGWNSFGPATVCPAEAKRKLTNDDLWARASIQSGFAAASSSAHTTITASTVCNSPLLSLELLGEVSAASTMCTTPLLLSELLSEVSGIALALASRKPAWLLISALMGTAVAQPRDESSSSEGDPRRDRSRSRDPSAQEARDRDRDLEGMTHEELVLRMIALRTVHEAENWRLSEGEATVRTARQRVFDLKTEMRRLAARIARLTAAHGEPELGEQGTAHRESELGWERRLAARIARPTAAHGEPELGKQGAAHGESELGTLGATPKQGARPSGAASSSRGPGLGPALPRADNATVAGLTSWGDWPRRAALPRADNATDTGIVSAAGLFRQVTLFRADNTMEADPVVRWSESAPRSFTDWAQVPPLLRAAILKIHKQYSHSISGETLMRHLRLAGASVRVQAAARLIPPTLCNLPRGLASLPNREVLLGADSEMMLEPSDDDEESHLVPEENGSFSSSAVLPPRSTAGGSSSSGPALFQLCAKVRKVGENHLEFKYFEKPKDLQQEQIGLHAASPRLSPVKATDEEALVRSLRRQTFVFPTSGGEVVAGISLNPAALSWDGRRLDSSSRTASAQASSQPMAALGSVRAMPGGDVPVTDLGARGSVRGTPDGDVPLERMQVLTIQPGTLAYHGTFEANVEGIAENGICQMGRVAIHLFKTWHVCCNYTQCFEAIACVDLRTCHDLGIKFGGDSSSVASQLQQGIVQVAGNCMVFAAMKEDGSVVTWGFPGYGGNSSSVASQLAGGVVQVTGTGNAFAAMKEDGSAVT